MHPFGTASATCPPRMLIEQLADKWALLCLWAVADKPSRFNALRRSIQGVSQKVLAQTLRRLESNGLVERTIFPTVPVTVEYAITPLGTSLVEAFEPLRAWAFTHFARDARHP